MSCQNFKIELLFFGHGNGTRMMGTPRHCHPFCQLEYCISGQLSSESNGKKFLLDAGNFWLIPPGLVHKFNKSSSDLDYISIKFTSSEVLPEKIINNPICQYYLEKIRSIIDGETPFNAYSIESKRIIENHLQGTIKEVFDPAVQKFQSEFMSSLHTSVCTLGAAANVDILAERFNLTRAEFKYRFLQENGHGKIKQYIDDILLNIAEQHMRYSNTSLNKIAEQMNFSSMYAFSRYYKHLRKITPSEFRKKAAKHESSLLLSE